MASTFETIIVKGDGILIDLLLWRRFKRATPGLVERILNANPELALGGPVLPIGTSVRIPIDAPNAAPERRAAVRLWD